MKSRNVVFMAAACLVLLTQATSAAEFNWKGDLRVRTETRFTEGAATDTTNRNRIRMRYGFNSEISDNLTAYVNFATSTLTGSLGENNSTNQTFTNFQSYPIFLDQAYIIYRPSVEILERYKLYAGKMQNFFKTTQLMWDGDTNPDGLGHEYNLGAFVFRASQWTQASGTLKPDLNTGIYGYQIGFMGEPVEVFISNYVDTSGTAANYWDLIGTLGLGDFKFTANYATETNTSKAGYIAWVDYKSVKAAGDWALKLGYNHYDDTFNPDMKDSDFGGPNIKGYILGFGYGIENNMALNVTYLGRERVTDGLDRTTLQIDLNTKF